MVHTDCPDLSLGVKSECEDEDSDYEDDACSLVSYHIGGRMLTTSAIRVRYPDEWSEDDYSRYSDDDEDDDGSTVAPNHDEQDPEALHESRQNLEEDIDGKPCFSV